MRPFRFTSLFDKSMPVGKLFGIPIRLHITILFFLLPALTFGRLNFWYSIEYAVGIVLTILVHELGHALTAKRYGMTGLSITLHGFGGFATSSGYRTPRQQLIIVLAGPGADFALGLILLCLCRLGQGPQFTMLWLLGVVNIEIGFLNLIPILPWDGGQAVQAILAHRMSEFKAMRYTAQIGLVLAPLLLIYGFVSNGSFFNLFAIVGLVTCLSMLLNSGGIRPGEYFQDRRHKKDLEAVKRREEERTQEYLSDVNLREKQREERERLKKLFEASGIEDDPKT